MVIAGEASGDTLAAELVEALNDRFAERPAFITADSQPLRSTLAPRFFGAGGPRMAAAGMEIAFDLTQHSVVGFIAVFRKYPDFLRLFNRLLRLACERQPDVIICVDFSGFNRRFAHAIRKRTRNRQGWFHAWQPKIVQYVSPQVWASREGRVYQMARDYDLVLSTFAFEKPWYAQRVPRLPVEFVGNPVIDRYGPTSGTASTSAASRDASEPKAAAEGSLIDETLSVLLLPGSRPSELARHLPVMKGALTMMRTVLPNLKARLVLPNEGLLAQSKDYQLPRDLDVRVGGLAEALRETTIAIASTGTVTVECAYFGVPAVAIYKTSWIEFQIGKQLVTVPYLAMPNLLADEEIYPELIAHMASAGNIARAALDLLRNRDKRKRIKEKLAKVVATLGTPGASRRAADAILRLEPGLLK